MTKIGKVTVNNVPTNHSRFAVARLNAGELWYWTSWDSAKQAEKNIIENKFDNAIIVELEA